jgi:osmotically-inducible protein OsmY
MYRPLLLHHLIYFVFAFLTLEFLNLLVIGLSPAYPRLIQIPGLASGVPQVLTAYAESARSSDKQESSERLREKLELQIRRELAALANDDVYENIDFNIDSNHVVTLLGTVRFPPLKTNAERVVSAVEGVRSVVDRLEVLPASPLDDGIRRAAFFKIYWQGQLRRYLTGTPSIHIIVKHGSLSLEGNVATESEKALAGLRANQVLRVFRVINNLKIQNPQQEGEYLQDGVSPPSSIF